MDNNEIARILREISEYLEMQSVPFKPRAYEKAAEVIEGLQEELLVIYQKGELKALKDIPGVGTSIAEHIEELLKTGKLTYYEQLKKKTPVDLSSLTRVQGLGPKKIKLLYQKLGIENLKDLEKAAKTGKIGKLEGFGKKSEENILKGIEFAKSGGGRFLLGHIMPQVRMLETRLKEFKEVEKIEVGGSVRRRRETIGDIDFLITSSAPEKVMEFFVRQKEIARVLAQGSTKSSVQFKDGLQVDLRVVPKESYGAALQYFTGSKDHNVALRNIAIQKGYKLNEYGLFKGEKMITGKTEEEIYEALGLDWIPPETRENTGEIQAAQHHKLPNLIGYDDLKGDLQTQTNWTDGEFSIEEMARAAMERGLEYIVITDHTKRLAMTHGLDEKRVRQQMKEIDKLNEKLEMRGEKFRILKGSECDILKDGSLDLPDAVLKDLDVVGVSIHSLFNLPREEQTKRIIRAMENPHADILFHPTGRLIHKREAYQVDMDAVISAAKRTGTILEIDAYPARLDLKDEYIRKCVEAGVKMSIDSDAHTVSHFAVLEFGIAQARRGWATKEDIINTKSVNEMLSMLKK